MSTILTPRLTFAHLCDVMPTFLELSGASYPETFNGESGRDIHGDSFADVLYDEPITSHGPVFMNRGLSKHSSSTIDTSL